LGSNFLYGSGTGQADYRIETCPAGVGDCIDLRRLVIYGGDIEVNGVTASNLIVQLTHPVWLPYSSSLDVDIAVGDLPMLLTYKIGNDRIAWQVSNTNASGGMIDPLANIFILDTLDFSGLHDGTRLTVELDIGGAHQ